MIVTLGLITLLVSSCTKQEPETTNQHPISYLKDTIPPCAPIAGSEQDPCSPGMPGSVATVSVSTSAPYWPLEEELPTIVDILLDNGNARGTVHLVVRGTVRPGTTRCELYPIRRPDFAGGEFLRGNMHYFCFVDVRINEYIIGTGPSELAVILYGEVLDINQENLSGITEEWLLELLQDPQARIAYVYEGKELVMFLRTTVTMVVEAWASFRSFGRWFVQRSEGSEPRAVSQAIRWARKDTHRRQLNLSLTELIQKIKKASEDRLAVTGGRIGEDPTLPLLVTDANYLRDFYGAVGAVYEGEGATVLPPPVPGTESPEQDPTRTGEGPPDPNPPIPARKNLLATDR